MPSSSAAIIAGLGASALRIPKHFVHRVGGRFPVRCEEVPVDVGGHADRRVTEHLAQDLDLHALGEHEPCSRVAELMGMSTSDAGLLADRLELPVDVARVEGLPTDVVNMYPVSCQDSPSESRCSAWRARWRRSDSTTGVARSTERRLFAVFVSECELAALPFQLAAHEHDAGTEIESSQRSPSASLRRSPVESMRT